MLSGRVNKLIERWQHFEIRGHMYHFDTESGVFPLFETEVVNFNLYCKDYGNACG
jgi:hypothetical protein